MAKWYGPILLALVLAACGSFPLPPVSERSTARRHPETAHRQPETEHPHPENAHRQPETEHPHPENAHRQPEAEPAHQEAEHHHPESKYREVISGDTLYSISWESGRDFRDVARWNDIAPPYLIKPGQKLRLFPPTVAEKSPPPATPRVITGNPTGNKKSAEAAPAVTSAPRAPASAAKPLVWSWPADGKLLEPYSASGPNKGIDISGRRGQPILAAAAGQVVYQGGGLRGYGQLIIIKHNADFLSAYAHCDKIYVKEANVIKRGQRIADMGSSGAERVKLHFEIRYRGAPVDPQEYLPRK